MAFPWLIRAWLQNAAQQKIRQTVIDAAKEHLAAQGGGDSADAAEPVGPRRCDVAVVYALETESGGLEDLLAEPVVIRGDGFRVCGGQLRGRRVAIVQSGAGAEKATKATEAFLDGYQPQWLISAGFAGGLSPGLARGHIVVADRLLSTGGGRLVLDAAHVPAALTEIPSVHVGALLTAERIIHQPEEKRALGQQYGALAVEMEAFAVAEVCRQREVPFLAVRAISDAVDDALPPDVDRLIRQKTSAARIGAALGTILHRPGSLKDMFQLKGTALQASDRLARFLSRLIRHLIPPEQQQDAEGKDAGTR